MPKTVLITGSTDGIGLEAAKMLVSAGHTVVVHGRNRSKLDEVARALAELPGGGQVERHLADLSILAEVEALARAVAERYEKLDVLINNAGVYTAPNPTTPDGLDVRFVVDAIAPYLLTTRLLPSLGASGRVVNVSSAAQSPVDLAALVGAPRLPDASAYAQSKLALTMWSRHLALELGREGPVIVAVNPGSLLDTKMVRQAFGMTGKDVRIGADILTRAALSDAFAEASGLYFDNDRGRFAPPHPDALDERKASEVVRAIDEVVKEVVARSTHPSE